MENKKFKMCINIPGGSFLSSLTLLFIGLKLTNYIAWHWFWILSPILIPLIIVLIIILIIFLLFIIGAILESL